MLSQSQLAALTTHFQHGSDEASAALTRWLARPAHISVEQVEQIPLGDAAQILGDSEGPVCGCAMGLDGCLTGELLLVFDDESGLALADLLLGNQVGTASEWGELEQSAALETANIIGCAYLNSLARCFQAHDPEAPGLFPSPPRFVRDFAEALMQFALMDQALVSDFVFITRTEFRIDGAPVNCNLVFVPNADGLVALRALLPA